MARTPKVVNNDAKKRLFVTDGEACAAAGDVIHFVELSGGEERRQILAECGTAQLPRLDGDGAERLRSRRGHVIYAFAVTENLGNFENTPDVGVSLTLAWVSLRP